MKKSHLIIVALFFGATAHGQSLKAGFENLSKQKYDDAAKVFSKALDKGNETLAAMYGMGLVYNTPEYQGFNSIKAFRMVRNANDRYGRASANVKKVCSTIYGFDGETINAKMNEIAKAELDKIIKTNAQQDYEWFITNYDGANNQVAEAKKRLAELLWHQVDSAGVFRGYKKFADDYPESEYAATALKKYEEGWKSICREYYSEGEIRQMQRFAKQYPDYPFYTENDKQDFATAETAEKLMLYSRYNSAYEEYYKKYIDQAAPLPLAYVALLRMISPYLDFGRWDEAANILKEYRDKFPNYASGIDKTIEILKEKSNKTASKSFSANINTEGDEYAPVLTADGRTLYFCGHGRADNIGGEDMFTSVKQIDGTWSKPRAMNEFNTPFGNEAPLAVSPDGNMLLIYKDSNIYFATKRYQGWSTMQKMEELNSINAWDADASFSPDGNAIFFISDRHGNIGRHHPHEELFHGSQSGNTDIYVCVKKSDDTWSEPVNLGNVINTPFAERSPMLAPDMKTLYFSSDGHYGLGRLDVFMSQRLSDTSWTQWSEPVNIGKEINTSDNDYNYALMPDGKSVFFTKFSNSGSDICIAELPEGKRPKAVASIFGNVKDTQGKFLPASIKWEDLETGEILGNLQCDPTSGHYFITLPGGKNYGYFVEHPGYYPVSGNLNTAKLLTGKNIEHNIIMHSIEDILTGKVSIVLSNIFFNVDKADLKSESFPELNRLATFLKSNPSARLEISGHTDSQGSEQHNKSLSEQRAQSVKNYLVTKGCNTANITAVGYGASKPVADNASEKGRAANRRVEFRILK